MNHAGKAVTRQNDRNRVLWEELSVAKTIIIVDDSASRCARSYRLH